MNIVITNDYYNGFGTKLLESFLKYPTLDLWLDWFTSPEVNKTSDWQYCGVVAPDNTYLDVLVNYEVTDDTERTIALVSDLDSHIISFNGDVMKIRADSDKKELVFYLNDDDVDTQYEVAEVTDDLYVSD